MLTRLKSFTHRTSTKKKRSNPYTSRAGVIRSLVPRRKSKKQLKTTVKPSTLSHVKSEQKTSVSKIVDMKQQESGRLFQMDNYKWCPEDELSLESVNFFIKKNKVVVKQDPYVESCNLSAKAICNEIFVRAALRTYQLESKNQVQVLVLDTPQFNTANLLAKAKVVVHSDSKQTHSKLQTLFPIRPENIHIPNPAFDLTKTKYNVSNCTMNMYLRKLKSVEFDAIWLDYCCSLDGNSFCKPRDDLELLFSTKKLRRTEAGGTKTQSMLAVTFSHRTAVHKDMWNCGSKDTVQSQNRLTAIQFIQKIAFDNQYVALYETERTYGQMFFLLFSIESF